MPAVDTGSSIRPTRILLVEDNPHDARFTRIALDEVGCGYKLIHVEDGLTAWLYLKDQDMIPPDLVLLDLRLPKLDGFQLLERMATLSTRPETVVLTGSTSRDKDRDRALALGARQYFQKPYGWDEWVRLAHDLCAICDEIKHQVPGS